MDITQYLSEEHQLEPTDLLRLQRDKLAALLERVRSTNGFYARKFADLTLDNRRDLLEKLPLTTRAEIEQDQAFSPPYGTLPLAAPGAYTRLHRTSGSTGRRLAWLDTPRTWAWWKRCWATIYNAAGVSRGDRVMFPFSFGPFIGFWAAFESAADMGHFVLPAGGLSTTARLECILEHDITVLCCTPTYALRLAEVADGQGIDLAAAPVTRLIVAGEPGGNIPATCARIEQAFKARVIDHAGMTEMGAWGFECLQRPGGLHVMENEFIAEVIDPRTGDALPEGQVGELVLTNLGRIDMPLIRYRTGDQVILSRQRCACGRSLAWLEGGVQGRLDDMLIIRGNNVFPATIEDIMRQIPEVVEFRFAAMQTGSLSELKIDVEPLLTASADGLADKVRTMFVDRLHFRPVVNVVKQGTLPRFEMKARRLVKEAGTKP